MTPERESPQEKKRRDYRERVSGGNRRNAEARKKEKKKVGHETRSKADELLAQVKPQLSAEDTEVIAGELTAAHLQKSVSRKGVRKDGAVPLSETLEWQRERRRTSFGRKTSMRPHYDRIATEAVSILSSLEGEQMIAAARRARVLCTPENRHKFVDVLSLTQPVDRALDFVRRAISRWSEEHQALCRNKDLDKAFTAWLQKANRILRKNRLAAQNKLQGQQAAKTKLRILGKKPSRS
jgi:hypothetical protein